jgi:hypothetical protein
MIDESAVDAREREDEELAGFDIGFQARIDEEPLDETATVAWKRGWQDTTSPTCREAVKLRRCLVPARWSAIGRYKVSNRKSRMQ